MSETKWRHEASIEAWDLSEIVIGEDGDTDFAIMDEFGYSIIVSKFDVPKLQNWLCQYMIRQNGQAKPTNVPAPPLPVEPSA